MVCYEKTLRLQVDMYGDRVKEREREEACYRIYIHEGGVIRKKTEMGKLYTPFSSSEKSRF